MNVKIETKGYVLPALEGVHEADFRGEVWGVVSGIGRIQQLSFNVRFSNATLWILIFLTGERRKQVASETMMDLQRKMGLQRTSSCVPHLFCDLIGRCILEALSGLDANLWEGREGRWARAGLPEDEANQGFDVAIPSGMEAIIQSRYQDLWSIIPGEEM
jgi:hypothetical protein